MFKNKLFILFFTFLLIVVAIGCGSSDGGDYIIVNESQRSDEDNYITYEVKEGKLLPSSGATETGIQLIAKDNSLKDGVILTVTEKNFDDIKDNYFVNASKIYGIYGVYDEKNSTSELTPFEDIDEPVSLIMPNTISGDAEAYYFGIRASDKHDWKFYRINEGTSSNTRMNANMLRADKSGIFTFITDKLNIEVALFARLNNSEKPLPATVINGISTLAEAAGGEKTDKDKIPVKSGMYDDNINLAIDVNGNNIGSLKLSDYVVEVAFANNYSNDLKDIFGTGAKDTFRYNPALGSNNAYFHSIVVNDLKGSTDKINFTINTKGVKAEEFPLKFSVVLKNRNTTESILPFEYTDNIKLETIEQKDDPVNPKEPAIPVAEDIIASAERLKKGDSVVFTWKAGIKPVEGKEFEKPKNVTYSVSLAKDGGDETVVAKGLIDTKWKSDALEIGVYSIKITALSDKGLSSESDAVIIEVVDSAFSTPVIEEMQPYYALGKAFEVKWSEVKDELQNSLKYNVRVFDSNGKIVEKFDAIESPSVKLKGLEAGDYSIFVLATDGKNTSEAAVRNFRIVDMSFDAPVMQALGKDEYMTGDLITFTWSEVKDSLERPVAYKLILKCDNSVNSAEFEVTETSWSSSELGAGSYNAKVTATNGEKTTESNSVSFIIKSSAPSAPVINPFAVTTYRVGEMVLISWLPSSDDLKRPVTYDLYVYTGDATVAPVASNMTTTAWYSTSLATGTYNVKVVAGNGTATSETIVQNAFTVMTSSRASICDCDGSHYGSGIYCTKPEFIVEISEKNFDEEMVSKAVTVEGVDASDVVKTWTDGKLKISFNKPLPYGLAAKVVMGSVNDKYETAISSFEDKQFTIVAFPGSGTDTDPFAPGSVEAVYATSEGLLALPSGFKTEVGIFEGMNFSDAMINVDGATKWTGLKVANVDNNPVVDIPENEMWPINTSLTADMSFKGEIEGKIYYFVASQKIFTTEDGSVICAGKGTDESPFLVYTAAQLDDVRNYSDSKIKQLKDIDMKGYVSSTCSDFNGLEMLFPVDADEGFTGVYDGNNHVIKNLRMVKSSGQLGLFGSISNSATIKNLGLEDCYISADGPIVGALAGQIFDGTVSNCYATGMVKSNRGSTSPGRVGGLIGIVTNGTIDECHFSGSVFSDTTSSYNNYVGGLIGYIENAEHLVTVANSYAIDLNIEGASYVGALIGYVSSAKAIDNCYTKSAIVRAANNYAGGLIGYCNNSSVSDCFAEKARVEGVGYVGGFVGQANSSTDPVRDCYVTASVRGTSNYVGGFMGYGSNLDLENCNATVSNVEGKGSGIGGLVGYSYCKSIKNSHVKASTILNYSNASNAYTGGFAGYCSSSGEYSDCSVKVETVTNYGQYTGLFTGYAYTSFARCCVEGIATGTSNVGGFAAYLAYGKTIKDCYCKGQIGGSGSNIGGLIGNLSDGSIMNSYTTCVVNKTSASTAYGCLFGNIASGHAYSCFTTQTPGTIPLNGGGTVANVVNCYSLSDGYDPTADWGEYPWDETIWDLTKPLPTLN